MDKTHKAMRLLKLRCDNDNGTEMTVLESQAS